MNCCECGCWELNPSLEEQPVLSTSELSLQPKKQLSVETGKLGLAMQKKLDSKVPEDDFLCISGNERQHS